jgi:hypothetical protein
VPPTVAGSSSDAVTGWSALEFFELIPDFNDAFTLTSPEKAPVEASCAFAQTHTIKVKKEINLSLATMGLLKGGAEECSGTTETIIH